MKIKKISQLIFRRVVIVALLLLLQIATMVVFQVRFSSYSSWFYFASVLASLLAVFAILTSRANPAYKIAWIILIMAFSDFRRTVLSAVRYQPVVTPYQEKDGGHHADDAAL